jgi:hypothetical protein
VTSRKIYDRICTESECNPNCGEEQGFTYLEPVPYLHISSSMKNESHDLRLMNIIQEHMNYIYKHNASKHIDYTYSMIQLNNIVKRVVYGVGLAKSDKSKGTKEDLTVSSPNIHNVTGAYLELKKGIRLPVVMKENQKNYNQFANLLGVMHVYDDGRPMKYDAV